MPSQSILKRRQTLTQAYHGPIPAQLICFLNHYQHQRTQTASPAQKVSEKVGLKKNGKLRLRDQPGFSDSPQTQIIQPKSPSTRPLSHSTDYGSDYEEPRPAVSPQDGALSEKQREEALRDQNKALSDDDHFKCKHPPFFIPVCCLGSLDLAELMVQGQTVFERVELFVSCKLVCFLDATLRGSVYIVVIG